MDLCLHVIRKDLGATVANAIARRMVAPPHRAGAQTQRAQSLLSATRDDACLSEVLAWASAHADQPITVGDIAARAGVSARTLIRRFHAELGITPARWLAGQRLARARELLERTDLSVDLVAERSGLGTAANLRTRFAREFGSPPTAYRRQDGLPTPGRTVTGSTEEREPPASHIRRNRMDRVIAD